MGQSKPFNPPAVLVVDRDEDERTLVAMLFEESDLKVIECTDAKEAQAAIAERHGNIAMVFIGLSFDGRRDGMDLARSLRAEYPAVHVIVTSTDPVAQLRGLPEGADFIQRPWRALDLLRRAESIHVTYRQ